jgi:predicted RNA methylase
LHLGVLRSFVLVFFKFAKLKSVIEFNNSARSSLVAVGGGDVGGTCGTLGLSILLFGDRDLLGVDVCNGSIVVEF